MEGEWRGRGVGVADLCVQKLGAKAAAKAGVADEEYAPDPYDSDADENAPAAEGAADNYTQAVREGIQR